MKYYYWKNDEEHFLRFAGMPKAMKETLGEDLLAGKSIAGKWQSYKFRFEKRNKPVSDFPFLGMLFVAMSERAFALLHDSIAPHVESFPLDIENSDRRYYGINVTKIYDIDLARSDIYGWPCQNNGVKQFYVLSIKKPAFFEDVLPKASIFRLNHTKHITIYVSEAFRQIVEKNNLTGFSFEADLRYRTGPEQGICRNDMKQIIPFNPDNLPVV